ncbi:MAG: chromosome segregation protein SMC [Beijerinckiaceae bacterium]|nr:chromosome segregation protein SMC [Beijerinckiaceae bacterium]
MRFDRLKIVGFKTFVDPVEFLIEPGLTGIVGPNGCGKSNLVEALRWVMGETSHKSMRGSGMDDVIFSGSGSRPSRNTAEVMLRIDNAERKAPAAFNDADILEISRRIEREEGSTYRINGREVRARDVQLLFADAASGARSPSLVRQGQIGEIIAAKPQARRRILEDAAGVAGLHSRRHEAELRLKAADDNLNRVEDVLKTIDGQLDSLRRQARQAGRYRAIAAQIRRAEAILHQIAVADARSQLALAQRQLGEDTRLVADRMREQGEAARSQAVAEHALEPLRLAEASRAAALQRLHLTRDGLDAEERRTKARVAELDKRLAELARDLDREKQLTLDAAGAVERLTLEDETLASEQGEAARLEAEADARSRSAEAALQACEAELAEMQAHLADRQARRAAAERAARDAGERLARAEQQLGAALAEKAGLDAKAAAPAAEMAALRDAAAETLARIEAAEARAQRAESAHRLAREAEAALRPALAEAERNAQRLETEARTIRKMLDGEANDLWPPIVEKIRVERGFETALGAALGEDLNASIEVTAPVHWRGLADGDPAGEAGAALPDGAKPIAAYVHAPAVLARRLAQIGIVARADGPRLQPLLKMGQRLVSKEGDLWRWDGFHAAAEAPTAAARRLAEKNRLGEIEAAAGEALARRDALRKNAEAAVTTARTAANAETEARGEAREARAAADRARQALIDAERRQADLQARLLSLEDALLRLANSRDEAGEADRAAKAALEETEFDDGITERVNEQRGRLALARAAAVEARADLQGVRREADFREKRRAAITAERAAWLSRSERAEAQEEEMQARLKAAQEERLALEEAPAAFAARRRALVHEIEQAEAARRVAADRKAEGETLFAEFDRLARKTLADLSAAREARAASEARVEAAEARLRHVLEAGEARSEAGHPDLAGNGESAELPKADAVEAELAELKRERERIGAVNLQADQELVEAEASQQNLVSERDDLVEAIRRLRKGIESLNAEGRERLIAAFDVVNGHFKQLFATLFGGGEAELTLIESDDPLEAGLEIIAKPPGKKPQVLTLLSGGEQALTASALIFAVFLTNPSPICVLDEIDAPLDDANVERLCDLLDGMVKKTDTRFVTITHNPITMARMDRLFGVTMAERGVSQLVSVDLNQAERLVEQA